MKIEEVTHEAVFAWMLWRAAQDDVLEGPLAPMIRVTVSNENAGVPIDAWQSEVHTITSVAAEGAESLASYLRPTAEDARSAMSGAPACASRSRDRNTWQPTRSLKEMAQNEAGAPRGLSLPLQRPPKA
jgi:hypothetical protein